MKSLVDYIKESSIERYSMKMTLKKFFELFMEYYKGSKYGTGKNSAIKWISDNLSKYSDGGPNKEDWVENNQPKEITFTIYVEEVSGKSSYVVELYDPDYDMMKMKFVQNDGYEIGEQLYVYFQNQGNKV